MSTLETPDVSCGEECSYSAEEDEGTLQQDLSASKEDHPFGEGHRRVVDKEVEGEMMMLPIKTSSGTRRQSGAPEKSSDESGETQEVSMTFLDQIRYTERMVKQRLRRKLRVRRRRIVGRVYLSIRIGDDPKEHLALHTVFFLEHRQSVLKLLHRLRESDDPIKCLVYSLYARRCASSRSEAEVFLMKYGMLEPHTMICEVLVEMANHTFKPISAVLDDKLHALCYEYRGCHNINISINPRVNFRPVTSSQVAAIMLDYNTHTALHFNGNYNRLANILGRDDNREERLRRQLEAQEEKTMDQQRLVHQLKVRFNNMFKTPEQVRLPEEEPSLAPKSSLMMVPDVVETKDTRSTELVPNTYDQNFPDLYSTIAKRPAATPQPASVAPPPAVRLMPTSSKKNQRSKESYSKSNKKNSKKKR